MRTGFPYIQLKLAHRLMVARRWRVAKASGSLASGATRCTTTARTKSCHFNHSATVLADDPALTVRWSELDDKLRRSIRNKISVSRYVL